jgi:hypothetical protein
MNWAKISTGEALWQCKYSIAISLTREPHDVKRLASSKSRDRNSAMFVGQVVHLGCNPFLSFFS